MDLGTFSTKLMLIVQLISRYFLVLNGFSRCTFPFNLPWLVSVKIPEFMSLAKAELLHTLFELTSTSTSICLVDVVSLRNNGLSNLGAIVDKFDGAIIKLELTKIRVLADCYCYIKSHAE